MLVSTIALEGLLLPSKLTKTAGLEGLLLPRECAHVCLCFGDGGRGGVEEGNFY